MSSAHLLGNRFMVAIIDDPINEPQSIGLSGKPTIPQLEEAISDMLKSGKIVDDLVHLLKEPTPQSGKQASMDRYLRSRLIRPS